MQPSYPPAAPPRRRLGSYIKIGIVALVVIGVVGIIVFRDRLTGSAGDLRVGDCIDEPSVATDITEVQHQPCSEPHDGEVFLVVTHNAPAGATYPLDAEFQDLIGDECFPAVQTYTGLDVGMLVLSGLDISAYHPTRESWNDGSRTVTCYVVKTDKTKLTGSLRAIGATPSPQ